MMLVEHLLDAARKRLALVLELPMENSTFSLALTGAVPAVCDAEAGESGSTHSLEDPRARACTPA
jgi:hypothetical protein